MKYAKFVLPLTILLFQCGLLFGQSTKGTLKGKVIDAVSNQPLPFVNIILLGTSYGTASDSAGEYRIQNIPVGSYQVQATLIGYLTEIRTDITVNPVKPSVIDISMQESSVQMQGVVSTTGYFTKDPNELISISNFSYEEIRRAPGGFEDVVRAVSVLPGVAQADAGRNDLIVRGGAPSENLYIVDGIPVPNINHFGSQGATGGPLSFINLDFVKGTEFSTGGFSVLYGDKLSSVLKIDLRDGRKDKIGGKATISASQFGLNAEGPVTNKTDFLFSLRRSYLDFIFKAAGFGFVPEYYDLLTKVNYKIDGRQSLSFLYIGAFDNVKFFNDTPDQRYSNGRILGSDQLQYMTGFVYKNLFDKGFFSIALTRSYTDFNTSQNDSLLNPVFLNKSKEGENVLTLDLVRKLSATSELNIGMIAKLINFKTDIKLPLFQTTFGDTLSITSLQASDRYVKFGFYAQYSNKVFDRLHYNIGFRVDYFNPLNTRFYFSPRFSMSYALSDITNLNLSTGIYYQSPSYIWLQADNRNKDLKDIRVDQYIAGFDHLVRSDMILKFEGFYKDYKDYPASVLRNYLVLANTGAGFSGSDDNFASFGLEPLVSKGKGNARGIELSLQKKSTAETQIYGLLSITYSQSDFSALDGVSRTGSYDQTWIVNLGAGFIFNEKWEASWKFRYATGKPYTPFNPDGTQSIVNYNSERTPANHSFDIRIDRRWTFENYVLITYLDIQNIYNRKNTSSVRWDYRTNAIAESSSIGILPTIGVSLEI